MYNDTITKKRRTAMIEEISGNPKEVNFLIAFLKFMGILIIVTFVVMVLFEIFSRINHL